MELSRCLIYASKQILLLLLLLAIIQYILGKMKKTIEVKSYHSKPKSTKVALLLLIIYYFHLQMIGAVK